MKEFSVDEWRKEGERRFGKRIENWKWRCPMCGKISSGQEFKDNGCEPDDCYVACIGRYNGNNVSPDKATGNGCNWVAYGLFGLPNDDKYIVDGKEIFPFADVVESEG